MKVRSALVFRLWLVVAASICLAFLAFSTFAPNVVAAGIGTGFFAVYLALNGYDKYSEMRSEASTRGIGMMHYPEDSSLKPDDHAGYAHGEPEGVYRVFEDVAQNFDVDTQLAAFPDQLIQQPTIYGGTIAVGGEWASEQDEDVLRARFGRLLSRLENQDLSYCQRALGPALRHGSLILGAFAVLLFFFKGFGTAWSLLGCLAMLGAIATVFPAYLRATTEALFDRAGYEAAGEWRASFFPHTQKSPEDNTLTTVLRERLCADLHR